jgi:hypothetical protein
MIPHQDIVSPGPWESFRVSSGIEHGGILIKGLAMEVSMISNHVLIATGFDPSLPKDGNPPSALLIQFHDGATRSQRRLEPTAAIKVVPFDGMGLLREATQTAIQRFRGTIVVRLNSDRLIHPPDAFEPCCYH